MKPRSPTITYGSDLILGTVENYVFYEIEPFLVTLRETTFEGHVCLFAGPNISARTIRKIESQDIEVIRYVGKFPFVGDPHPKAPKWLPEPIYIFNYRHFLYYDYLLKHGRKFRNVLLADVKDVVFQANPFDCISGDETHVAMENTSIKIGDCYWTRSWLRAGYDEEVFERLKDHELSCAGTTIAPVRRMERYLQLMLAQVMTMKDAHECADQAAHNLLLHEGTLEPVARLYNFEGPILTVGTEPVYELDDRKRLVNRDGSVVAIVHQYDRHPELVKFVRRRVRPALLSRLAAGFGFSFRKRIGRRLARLRRLLRGRPHSSVVP